MRTRFIFRVVSIVALVVGSLPSGPAAFATTSVTLPQLGTADGLLTYSVFVGLASEGGAYRTLGQLGMGRWSLDVTSPDASAPCDPSKLTGTVRFIRSDGATLQGAVTSALRCGEPLGTTTT